MTGSMPRPARALAAVGVLTLVATACAPADEGPAPGVTPTEAAGGEYSVYVCEPEHLVPTNTNETCGSEVLNALFTPLVQFDPETAEALWGEESPDAVADEITSDDQQTWTIKLKDGWAFHNGDPVTAQDYVNAWNFGAYAPNAQGNAHFFESIRGYEELQPPEGAPEGTTPTPTGSAMEGLQAVDDRTLRVELSAPFSQFPLMLGYTAFYPMPEEAFEDMRQYEQAPIGNGPFEMDGEWEHNERIRVARFENYAGDRSKAEAVEFRIYSEINTAYNDLLDGNLDVMDDVPPERVREAKQELGDRYFEAPSSSFAYIGFPLYADPFGKSADLRRALSMAIDRQAIIDAGLRPGQQPADAFVSPVVPGYRKGVCGESCRFNPDRARQLLRRAGGFTGQVNIWFNSGAGHEGWMTAVANQWRQHLGIRDVKFQTLQFAQYLEKLDQKQVTGPFRLGWVMDYPSPQNYLEPLHGSTGSSNNSGYRNPEFDRLVEQGNQAATIEEATRFYQQAEDLLVRDMPIIPMFFEVVQGAHSERVSNVVVDPFDRINTSQITVRGD